MKPILTQFFAAFFTFAAFAPNWLMAQIIQLGETAKEAQVAAVPSLLERVKSSGLKDRLKRVQAAVTRGLPTETFNSRIDELVLTARVASDFPEADNSHFLFYSTPAMSDQQRLEDNYPIDGVPGGTVRIIAAKEEFEPGAFLVYPLRDLGKVTLSLSEFKTDDGKIFPTDKLDLKVVKVWYQNKNAWYSYFGDTDFKLVPELLLHDEDLIRVDTDKKANYARIKISDDKIVEHWINPPRDVDRRFFDHYRTPQSFAPMQEGFADAPALKPVTLTEGNFRSFFLTAHVTKSTPEGLYKGSVELSSKGTRLGSIPVTIKVLPFELPSPKTYFNPERDFLTTSYSYVSFDLIAVENGGDYELAKNQFLATLKNQVEHNETIHWLCGDKTEIAATLDIMKKAGKRTDILLSNLNRGIDEKGPTRKRDAAARRLAKWYDSLVGHHNVYIGYGDEPGAKWLMNTREIFKSYQRAGMKFIIAGGDSVFYKAGYIYDWHNVAKDPTDGSSTALWNQLDNAFVAWYACMHIGPENPAYNRRQYGMAPYLANYSAACNYAHHFGPYNDDRITYRPMVFAYGTHDGVIDTLQWEGFREGIDDIRYATYLSELSREAVKSNDIDIRYAGLKARQLLATVKREEDDLNALRLEMTTTILNLRRLLKK